MKNPHTYKAQLLWDGNLGEGTSTYPGYGRQYRVLIDGKPDLHGSADPMFRGEAEKHNPEDLFLAAVSSCHMLSYLALCARGSINVISYRDEASGDLFLEGGGGRFVEIRLRPVVTIADAKDLDRARALHEKAHELCFIANSCSVPIRHEAVVRVEGAAESEGVIDLAIELEDRPGALAEMGEALGRAGVSVEGGGVFVANGAGIAHFLFTDGRAAREALENAGIRVVEENEVVTLRLRQDEPGQLGRIARRMAEAGVNIRVQYSDHDHQLILVVDDPERGREVSAQWMQETGPR